MDLATDLLKSEREICSGVRPDESSATVTRGGGDFAAESKPRDLPAAETAGKGEEEDLRRLAGWKKSIRVLDVDEAISVSDIKFTSRRKFLTFIFLFCSR